MKAYDAWEIMKFEILTTGNEVTEKRLKDFKERLKKIPQRVDILITSHIHTRLIPNDRA